LAYFLFQSQARPDGNFRDLLLVGVVDCAFLAVGANLSDWHSGFVDDWLVEISEDL
jgi:hypothetical protein